MVACHPLQTIPSTSCVLPRRIKCHNQLLVQMLDKTSLKIGFVLANLMLRMAKAQKRTRYLIHLDLAHSQQVVAHLVRKQLLHHLVHRKLEFDVPTKVVWRYTNHACYLPTRNILVTSRLVQSLPCHFAQHHQLLLQVVLLLQTIVLKVLVQLLSHIFGNDQLREHKDASLQLRDLASLTLQQLLYEHRIDPCHQILYRYQPLHRAHS